MSPCEPIYCRVGVGHANILASPVEGVLASPATTPQRPEYKCMNLNAFILSKVSTGVAEKNGQVEIYRCSKLNF